MSKHKILIPLDGSRFSQQILPKVCDLFSPADNELILLRVAPAPQRLIDMPAIPVAVQWSVPTYNPPQDVELTKHIIYANQLWDSQVAMFENELRTNLLNLHQVGYTVSTAVRFGEPVQEILNFIAEEKVDLVAMTSHGRTGLSRLMFGSVAEAVLHEASVPVILLRLKGYPSEPLDR